VTGSAWLTYPLTVTTATWRLISIRRTSTRTAGPHCASRDRYSALRSPARHQARDEGVYTTEEFEAQEARPLSQARRLSAKSPRALHDRSAGDWQW
jgi:hypothetical protein